MPRYGIDPITGNIVSRASSSSGLVLAAVFGHSKPEEKFTISSERSPLIVDGKTTDSFSDFSYPVWDVQNSRIRASKVRENFSLRVRFLVDSEPGTVLTIWLWIPETNQRIYPRQIQPMQMIGDIIAQEFSFYSSLNFVQHGLMLAVSAVESATIYQPSLYIKKDG